MYYFIILAGIFLSALSIKFIKFYIGSGKNDWQMVLAEEVLDWCKELYPIRKKRPAVVVNKNKSQCVGEYNFYSNQIIIYVRYLRRPRSVIHVVVHEFFHYWAIRTSQDYNSYYKLLQKHKYINHPAELLCETMAKVLTKKYMNEKNIKSS